MYPLRGFFRLSASLLTTSPLSDNLNTFAQANAPLTIHCKLSTVNCQQAAYKSVHGVVNRGFSEETKFSWNSDTVSRILANRNYVGDTVNGKTTKKSFKLKKRIDVPSEEWQIVPNTQEPIIDRDCWQFTGYSV